MLLVLMGSIALNHHQFTRKHVDVDMLGTYEDCTKYIKQRLTPFGIRANYPADGGKKIIVKTTGTIYEFEVAWPGSDSEMLLNLIKNDPNTKFVGESAFPSLNVLYMLKMSHRYRKDSPHFKKTMDDILLMRSLGARMQAEYSDWYALRERNTYTNTLPKLNQSKKDFFDNSSNIYTLDHDSIHEAVKHLERPAYEYFKPDTAEVLTSKDMFFACPRYTQICAALEEVMVLSIERSIHPFPNVDKRWAFDMAHMKLATSISSGWFREFVWETYYSVQGMYSEDYVHKFYAELEAGNIKPFVSEQQFEQPMKEAA